MLAWDTTLILTLTRGIYYHFTRLLTLTRLSSHYWLPHAERLIDAIIAMPHSHYIVTDIGCCHTPYATLMPLRHIYCWPLATHTLARPLPRLRHRYATLLNRAAHAAADAAADADISYDTSFRATFSRHYATCACRHWHIASLPLLRWYIAGWHWLRWWWLPYYTPRHYLLILNISIFSLSTFIALRFRFHDYGHDISWHFRFELIEAPRYWCHIRHCCLLAATLRHWYYRFRCWPYAHWVWYAAFAMLRYIRFLRQIDIFADTFSFFLLLP